MDITIPLGDPKTLAELADALDRGGAYCAAVAAAIRSVPAPSTEPGTDQPTGRTTARGR